MISCELDILGSQWILSLIYNFSLALLSHSSKKKKNQNKKTKTFI